MERAASGWALWRGVRGCASAFRDSARRTPRTAWVRWARAIVLGAILVVGLMAGLTLVALALRERGLEAWDEALLRRVTRLPLSFQAAVFWEAFGASSVLVPVTAVATVLAVRAERPVLAAEFVAAFVLAKPIVLVGWTLWDRARPELVAGGIAAPPLHSYPSGHTVQALAIYGLLTHLWIRRSASRVERALGGSACMALVAIVGLSRLRMGVHWPSDVIVGAVIGAAWLAVLLVSLRRAERAGGR